LIRGRPRSGKTTIIQEVISHLKFPVVGFFTEEVLQDDIRIGFDAICINNNLRAPLARIGRTKPTVGKYSVLIQRFEDFLDNCMNFENISFNKIIIDEIGKMECYSKKFLDFIEKAFKESRVLGTIPIYSLPLVNHLLSCYEIQIIDLHKKNREFVKSKVKNFLLDQTNQKFSG
jgi:nucleoside-triphosphatase THEP1